MTDRWTEAQAKEQSNWNASISKNDTEYQKGISVFRFSWVMGLTPYQNLKGITVLDIGGGFSSILPTFVNYKHGTVVDPIAIPDVIGEYYYERKITYARMTAEEFLTTYHGHKFDEIWIYNLLKHVADPYPIMHNLSKVGKVLRFCEIMDDVVDTAHLRALDYDYLYKNLISISTKQDFRQAHQTYDIYMDLYGGVFELK
jgi:2-polyprenyl-3-methyl-5-hydroxy-6-metoxy-1,4-benzoquinol methylase